MKNFSLIDTIRFLLLLVLVSLVCLYNHPFFNDMKEAAGIEKGSVLSPYINLSFVILFLLSFRIKAFQQCYVLRRFTIFLLIIFFALLLASAFFRISPVGEARMFVIPLAALIIGYVIHLTKTQYRIFTLFFLVIISYVAFMQITTNIGAFVIEDQYLVDNKNSLGLVIGTGIILAFILALDKDTNVWLKVFYLVVAIFLLYCILTIRARTAMLTAVFLCFYVVYLRNGRKRIIYTIAGIGALFLIVLLFVPSVLEYFYASVFSGYEGEDVTADRLNRNAGAISAIMDDPFFCKLAHDYGVHQVHNFFLKTWYEKGLFFGWPILVMYVLQFIDIVKCSIKKCDINNHYSIGFLLGLYPFLNSLAETTLPYGPGTDSVINFILWGMACRQLVDKEKPCYIHQQISPSI
jgi:hypothetical protein